MIGAVLLVVFGSGLLVHEIVLDDDILREQEFARLRPPAVRMCHHPGIPERDEIRIPLLRHHQDQTGKPPDVQSGGPHAAVTRDGWTTPHLDDMRRSPRRYSSAIAFHCAWNFCQRSAAVESSLSERIK